MKVFNLYMDRSNNPNHRNSICSLATHWNCGWKFPWVKVYFWAFESIWAWHTSLICHICKNMDIQKVKADQLTQFEGQSWACHTSLISIYRRKWTLGRSRLITWPSLPLCPVPSVWSQIWKWKHLKSMLNFLAMYILQNSFKIKWKKHFFIIQLKQCLLWTQVSNFTFY